MRNWDSGKLSDLFRVISLMAKSDCCIRSFTGRVYLGFSVSPAQDTPVNTSVCPVFRGLQSAGQCRHQWEGGQIKEIITLHCGCWGETGGTEVENIKAGICTSLCRVQRMPLRGGWRTRHAKNQGKPCRAKGTELAKSLRWERLWCSYGNKKTDVILVGCRFRSFWPLGHTVLKKGAIIECSKGEKGHGPVAI